MAPALTLILTLTLTLTLTLALTLILTLTLTLALTLTLTLALTLTPTLALTLTLTLLPGAMYLAAKSSCSRGGICRSTGREGPGAGFDPPRGVTALQPYPGLAHAS